jgi:hypothetical protein
VDDDPFRAAVTSAPGKQNRRRLYLPLDDGPVASTLDVPPVERAKAGAASGSPVRKLKQAWCQGQRTMCPTKISSAREAP